MSTFAVYAVPPLLLLPHPALTRTMYKQYIPSFISATDIFITDLGLERVSTGGRLAACACETFTVEMEECDLHHRFLLVTGGASY